MSFRQRSTPVAFTARHCAELFSSVPTTAAGAALQDVDRVCMAMMRGKSLIKGRRVIIFEHVSGKSKE